LQFRPCLQNLIKIKYKEFNNKSEHESSLIAHYHVRVRIITLYQKSISLYRFQSLYVTQLFPTSYREPSSYSIPFTFRAYEVLCDEQIKVNSLFCLMFRFWKGKNFLYFVNHTVSGVVFFHILYGVIIDHNLFTM
jgi:hypothetical protein